LIVVEVKIRPDGLQVFQTRLQHWATKQEHFGIRQFISRNVRFAAGNIVLFRNFQRLLNIVYAASENRFATSS
jgi:hypothetical protein